MRRKMWIRLGIVACVILVIVGIWNISSFLVSKVGRKPVETVEVETREPIVFVGEPESNSEYVSSFQDVDRLFNTDGAQERSKSFLGDDYEKYEPVITSIRAISDSIFSKLGYKNEYNVNEVVDYDVSHVVSLGLKDGTFFDAPSFMIFEMLTVIDVFGDDIAICAFNYPSNPDNEIVVVDFSRTKVNREITELFDIGDVMSVKGSQGYYDYRKLDDFYVLFIKAD